VLLVGVFVTVVIVAGTDLVFRLAVKYMFLTDDGLDALPELVVEPFNATMEQNDYEVRCYVQPPSPCSSGLTFSLQIPWSLRDLIAGAVYPNPQIRSIRRVPDLILFLGKSKIEQMSVSSISFRARSPNCEMHSVNGTPRRRFCVISNANYNLFNGFRRHSSMPANSDPSHGRLTLFLRIGTTTWIARTGILL
jgi:hypothetical protein